MHLTVTGNHLPTITSGPPGVTLFEDNSASAAPNLVANGGFETGSLGPWILNGGSSGIDSSTPHSGGFDVELGTSGGDGTLSQTFATVPGTTYAVNFWLKNGSSGTNDFSVNFGGTQLFSTVNAGSSGYTEHTINVVASSSSTTLTFTERNDPSFWFLDDVSVKPAATATNGVITFTDADTTDRHTVSVTPSAGGYYGVLTAALAGTRPAAALAA